MKSLNGRELAGFVKERQAGQVARLKSLGVEPRLAIVRDMDDPVIHKYVELKKRYGEDIGITVIDELCGSVDEIRQKINELNTDEHVDGIILQLPISNTEMTEELTGLIAPEKDVDGLSGKGEYDSATATAIIWLLAGYDIKLNDKKIALVGRGKLVGAPLMKMWEKSGVRVEMFHRGSDLTERKNYDVIVTATGVPGLIKNEMVASGAVIVDAGTASEKGMLKGDVSDEVRGRADLAAITPVSGGVGPLTVSCLFDHVIRACEKRLC